MEDISAMHLCLTIGPLHRQKLILDCAKAQPIWDSFSEGPKTPEVMPDIWSYTVEILLDRIKISQTKNETKVKDQQKCPVHSVWQPNKSAGPALVMFSSFSLSNYSGTSAFSPLPYT